MAKILVTEPVPESTITLLETAGKVDVGEKGYYLKEANLVSDISQYDAVLTMLSNPVTKKVIKAASELKVIANFAVGYNNIDIDAAAERGIKVANTPDVLTEACGDYAMGLLFALSRHFNEAEAYLRQGKFRGWEPLGFLGMELRNKKLGIIGMGRIGQAFANRARAFGMQIFYHNRNKVDSHIEKELNASFVDDPLKLAAMCDVISLNCPLTEETYHLVDEVFLNAMQSHALLINISRGAVIDEAGLARALHKGKIAGAALDVFEREPEIHPELLTAPNTLLLPHIASATYETRNEIGLLAARAIVSVLKGEPDSAIPNLVTP